MVDHSYNLGCCFFVCVVISDSNFFQETVLLNPYFMFSKNLILSLTDNLDTGT